MSLLEDVFLEDEAGEAQELERVIEGDEFEERPRSISDSDENSEKDDEAEEDKRRIDPTSAKPKRVIKNPRFVLNPARLTGPRGIQVIPEHFKDFKFKGKGHEREDLDLMLKKLEHWAYRLYPKFQFEDCLKKIETLGKKRPVMVHLQKIRSDQITSEETVVQKDSSDEEPAPVEEDEFDKLLQQQIESARALPAPTPTPTPTPTALRPSMMPKATSSPSINDEQRERMLRNRMMAEERRLARLNQATRQNSQGPKTPENVNTDRHKENIVNATDSSDNEDNVVISNVNIDIHECNIELNSSGKLSESPNNANHEQIDSSDEEIVTNQDKDIIELDSEGRILSMAKASAQSEAIKLRTSAKKNKNVFNSSDEENALNRSTSVSNNHDIVELDLGQVMSKSLINKSNQNESHSSSEEENSRFDSNIKRIQSIKHTKKNKPNVIDSDDDALVINDNVDTTNKNTSINTDSSDDDGDLVMNESVSVDVHINKIDIVFDNLKAKNIQSNDIIKNKEIQSSMAENKTDPNTINSNKDNSKRFENFETYTKARITESVSEKNTSNKIDVQKASESDDIMDVDFSDDL